MMSKSFTSTIGYGALLKDGANWAASYGATVADSIDAGTSPYCESDVYGGGNARIIRAFFTFNTSTIPDNATILSSTIKLRVYSVTNTDNDGSDHIGVYQGTYDMTRSLVSRYDNSTNSTDMYSGSFIAMAQSFTAISGTLKSCKFYLKKVGTPTGNMVAKLYNHSGTFGTNSVPTGSAIAVSDEIVANSLTTSSAWTTFTFSGANRISLTNGTNYVIAFEYSSGDASNCVSCSWDSVTVTHPGNRSTLTGTTWTGLSSRDMRFVLDIDYNNAMSLDDYASIGTTIGSNAIDIGDLVDGAEYNTWTLNATGLSWISKTGYTKIGFREGHDASNSAVNTGTSNSMMYTYGSDSPILTVNYVLPLKKTMIVV